MSPTLEEGTTGAPITSSPTMIPTDVIILPPDPLPYPSDDPTDHWFCGVSLDDADVQCQQHCPTAAECPMGEICFFGTKCDARTHSPTPPPTRGPTDEPTTSRPTLTISPTAGSTVSCLPTTTPSLPQPSQTPTLVPTPGPTFGPMPALMAGFFCGIDWDDAITNCKRRCPTGESTECPFDEECFSMTECEEERGYPEEFGGANVTTTGEEECVPFQVTIVSDNWPKEISWMVVNIDMNETIAEGTNDDLVPGEAVDYDECFKSRLGCYQFTINDTGGDGICCKDGEGSYIILWDGEMIKKGSTFYESETTSFGLCGESEQPTPTPLEDDENDESDETNEDDDEDVEDDNESSKVTVVDKSSETAEDNAQSGVAYRCVAEALVDKGYEVSSDKCNLFVDCFNRQISVADDWFCEESEKCVSVPACRMEEDDELISDEDEGSVTQNEMFSSLPTSDSRPTDPDDVLSEEVEDASLLPTTSPAPTITPLPESTSPTDPIPTGPCSGPPCDQDNHCRSQFGFCGPDKSYCDETATWTKDCPAPESSSPTSAGSVIESMSMSMSISMEHTLSPSQSTESEDTMMPSVSSKGTLMPSVSSKGTLIPTVSASQLGSDIIPFSKPEGGTFSKPNGGKGKGKPARTNPPTTLDPMMQTMDTSNPTAMVTTVSPTVTPTVSLTTNTESPSSIATDGPSIADSSKEMTDDFWSNTYAITSSPSLSPENVSEGGSPIVDDSATEATEEGCTGEPCPVTTHCRSRYGSCGPGFIYCNMYTTWKSTCPSRPRGTRPTRAPTVEGSSSIQPYSSILTPSFSGPTLPPLTMPTLPSITKAEPFNITASFSATGQASSINSTGSYATTDEGYAASDIALDDYSNVENQVETPSESAVWNDSEYLAKWISETSSSSDDFVISYYLDIGLAITTLLLLIL